MLESRVLSKDDFVEWGKDYVLFLHNTSHVEDEPYPNLLKEKGGTGFPTLMFMDAEGKVLAVHRGPRSLEGFTKSAEKAREYLRLREAAAKGDGKARVRLLLLDLEMGGFDPKDARDRLDALGDSMSEEDREKAEQKIVDKEVAGELNRRLRALRGKPRTEIMKAYRETVVDLFRKGMVPSDRSGIGYMVQLGSAALESGDAKFREKVLDTLESFRKKVPMYGRYLKPVIEKLESKIGDSDEEGEEEEEHEGRRKQGG